MKNNHMRVMLCLLMCCALLFTCVARPASATPVAVVAGLAAIPVAVAVACAFQALGCMSSSNSTAFTNTVNQASSWLTDNTDWILNGFVTIMGLTSGSGTVSYLPRSFIQDLWQWLFSSSNSISLSSKYSSYYFQSQSCSSISQALIMSAHCPQAFSGYTSDGKQFIIVTSNSGWVTYDGSTLKINGSGTSHSKYVEGDDHWSTLSSVYDIYTYTNMTKLVTTPLVQSNADIQLGNIQTPYYSVGTEEETIQIEIAPIYIDWTKYGVPDPNNPETPPEDDPAYRHWLPTGIPSPEYDDSIIKQNQQQAQSGVVTGDITFEPYQPDSPGSGGGGAGTGTDLSSVIQTIINVPSAIVTGIGDFISDYFGFSENHDGYFVRLRDFFPFCIPFDLYDFITVLSAEPEAPVFHWEIPVPQLGQTFELEVDLSAWDDIAVLFRNLELLAFIFGLAVMTREKFLRS